MADITEAEQWDSGVYQLETTDPVQGGVDGVDNIPHKALANRTVWLKAQLALKALLGGSATQLFKAKAGIASDDVVNKGQLDTAIAGASKVLQVIQTVVTAGLSYTNISYADLAGYTATITPVSANSKILIMISLQLAGDTATAHSYYRLQRNGADIFLGTGVAEKQCTFHKNINDSRDLDVAGGNYLDSPATTNAVTYTIQGATQGGQVFRLNHTNVDTNDATAPSTITLMEIGA